ncbi:MAG: hypothetical protein MJ195_01940 [Mycoplasmoidaceae bacterium]|nr:hypothetical protein [Mycoplasmoidaceae bacterium]
MKSDDTVGRNLTYNSIIKGLPLPKPSLPESFKLLTKQLQGLCLSMTVTDQKGVKHDMDDFSRANIDVEEEQRAEQPADEEVSTKVVDDSEYGSL